MTSHQSTNPTKEVTIMDTIIETRPVGQCDTCGEYFHSLIAIGHKLDGPFGPIYWSAPTCSVECHDGFYAE